MRKLFIFMLTLLSAVGAWAAPLTAVNQIKDGYIYTFKPKSVIRKKTIIF